MDAATAQRSHTATADTLQQPVPATFRGYLRANPDAAIAWGALAVIASMVALRGWATARGWFIYDDLSWLGIAAAYDRPGLELLSTPWNGHVMPGGWLVVWLFTTLAPLQYWPVVLSSVLLQVAIGWMLFLVLRRLFGSRPEILLLLALGLLSSLSLQASLWWAVGMAQLPLLLASLVALWAHLGYLRSGRLRDAALVVAAVVGGLAFSERTLLVLPLLALLTVGWFSGLGRPHRVLRRALLPHWPLWTALAAVAAAFTAYYVSQVPSEATSGGDLALFADVLEQGVLYALLPALVGGPWDWLTPGEGVNYPNPSPALIAATAALAVLVVVGSCVARRHAARAWWLLVAFLVAGGVMLTLTRATVYGATIGREYRYFTELVLVGPLAIGLALLPVRWPSRTGTVELAPRRLPRALQVQLDPWRPVADLVRRRAGLTVAMACTLFVLSSAVSTAEHDENWHPNSAREYLGTVRTELADDPGARLVDARVPRRVDPFQEDEAQMSHVLRPITEPSRFLTAGGAAGDELRILDDDGRLRPVSVQGPAAVAGPVEGCGHLATEEAVSFPLESASFDGRLLMSVDYFTGGDVSATVTAGRTRTDVVFREGLHTLYAVVEGPVTRVSVQLRSADVDVCVSGARVGVPAPVPAG